MLDNHIIDAVEQFIQIYEQNGTDEKYGPINFCKSILNAYRTRSNPPFKEFENTHCSKIVFVCVHLFDMAISPLSSHYMFEADGFISLHWMRPSR